MSITKEIISGTKIINEVKSSNVKKTDPTALRSAAESFKNS